MTRFNGQATVMQMDPEKVRDKILVGGHSLASRGGANCGSESAEDRFPQEGTQTDLFGVNEFENELASRFDAATGVRRFVYQVSGLGCVALGIAGVFLPVVPTTPFLILASFLFYRSSPSLYQRLLRHRFSGPLLRKWEQDRGVSSSVKLGAIGIVVVTVAITLQVSRVGHLLQLLICGLACIGVIVIILLPAPRRLHVALVRSETPVRQKVG